MKYDHYANWTSVTVQTRPASEPVSLAEAKSAIPVYHSDDDTLIADLITAAIDMIDGPKAAGIGMMEQTWRVGYDCFPGVIKLPGWPVKSVTSVKYYDVNNSAQTVSSSAYYLDLNKEPARIEPVNDWPATEDRPGAVWVDYVVGESSEANVPEPLKIAVLHLVSHWWRNRGEEMDASLQKIPFGFQAIIDRYKQGFVSS